jgi:glycogen debranching enzyme
MEIEKRGKNLSTSEKRAPKRARKEEVISQPTPSVVRSIADAIVIKDRNLFFLTRRDGSVPLNDQHGFGLYYNDCRFLSGYTLELGNTRPHALVSNASRGFLSILQLSNEAFAGLEGSIIPKEHLGIKWKRMIDSSHNLLADSIVFQNFSLEPMNFEVSFSFASSFDDIFTVRGLLRGRSGTRKTPKWEKSRLIFTYLGEDRLNRNVCVHFFPKPNVCEENVARYKLSLGPQEAKECVVTVALTETSGSSPDCPELDFEPDFGQIEKRVAQDQQRWLTQEAKVESDSLSLNRTLNRSLLDLKMLESTHENHVFFAAGVPWFATLFGRDSLVTAIQTLAYNPDIAEQTLKLLARYQGRELNEWRDEAPGKILHELRVGELARTGEIPHTPYYGTVDATPLFLILLARHAQWTGSLALFHSLRENVERALAWIRDFADLEKDGYLKYDCRSDRGLTNQGWKDSWDGIMNADGSLVTPPIALVEVQGYVYDAKLGIAALYEKSGDNARAAELREEASRLKKRFNEDFWVEESQFYALALQSGGRPANVISSNQGHLLWSGIADADKAKLVVERLMREDMFSGWGIRTLSEREKRYNPLGYHLGTIWPHDNSIIAAGFKRYGFSKPVLELFNGIFRASIHFDNQRLPELFAGFSEKDYGVPVHYPVACHPQAWASATIPHLIETLLGFNPDGFSKRLRITHPVLPEFLDRLEFRRLRIGEALLDLGFSRTPRGSVAVEVLKLKGEVEVVVEPNL